MIPKLNKSIGAKPGRTHAVEVMKIRRVLARQHGEPFVPTLQVNLSDPIVTVSPA